jgi:hypothetical protein
MKFRRYCVTVMDNWTPMQVFWTFKGARKFYESHRTCANVFKWKYGKWCMIKIGRLTGSR